MYSFCDKTKSYFTGCYNKFLFDLNLYLEILDLSKSLLV
jgi:hypothetical protein